MAQDALWICAKANAFNQEYAEVSGRRSDKTSRKKAVALARRIRSYVTKDPAESNFTTSELERALGKVRVGKLQALAGSDPITLEGSPLRPC